MNKLVKVINLWFYSWIMDEEKIEIRVQGLEQDLDDRFF